MTDFPYHMAEPASEKAKPIFGVAKKAFDLVPNLFRSLYLNSSSTVVA